MEWVYWAWGDAQGHSTTSATASTYGAAGSLWPQATHREGTNGIQAGDHGLRPAQKWRCLPAFHPTTGRSDIRYRWKVAESDRGTPLESYTGWNSPQETLVISI